MIDKLRSERNEVRDVHDFKVGELYLQHCQQYEENESPEDILRIFRVRKDAAFGIDKDGHNIVTLIDQPVYTTNLNPEKFDKGSMGVLDQFRISFETYMGHFYKIHNGYQDIETLFGVHLREHERMEKATKYGRNRLETEPAVA